LVALEDACRHYPATDMRAFVFVGEQLLIPMVDELSVNIRLMTTDGKSFGGRKAPQEIDRSNLKTGIIVKLVDDMIGMGATEESDSSGDDEFTFM